DSVFPQAIAGTRKMKGSSRASSGLGGEPATGPISGLAPASRSNEPVPKNTRFQRCALAAALGRLARMISIRFIVSLIALTAAFYVTGCYPAGRILRWPGTLLERPARPPVPERPTDRLGAATFDAAGKEKG